MSQTQSKEFKRPQNVVRLKIDGAKTTVNTLRDVETGRGVSLVCPFPALEVDIPVSFGEGEATTKGAIHRIGVEDDPRTGLPRLRLAIRAEDTKTTVETQTGQSLLDATRIEDVDDTETAHESSETDNSEVQVESQGPMVRPLVSWADALGKTEKTELINGVDDDSEFCETEDPEWVDCCEVPLPEQFFARNATRRRYRVMKHMAAAFVLGMLVAAGYLLDRSGIVNFSSVTHSIASFYGAPNTEAVSNKTDDAILLETSDEKAVAEAVGVQEKATPASAPAVESAPISPAVETASYSSGANPLLGEKATPAETAPSNEKVEAADNTAEEITVADATGAKAEADAEKTDENVVETPEGVSSDITLNLPTRWPVEYATAYRVRDPNGVVVDVPGGLVRREGWLETGRQNPMIRSVKAIQRESGARFVVYVTGNLPRFITSPKGNGVSLRLYYEDNTEDTTTVAALQ